MARTGISDAFVDVLAMLCPTLPRPPITRAYVKVGTGGGASKTECSADYIDTALQI